MRLIDADAFKAEGRELYRAVGWDLREVHYSQMDVECNIDNMPTIEPTLYGYELNHLAFVAALLQSKGVTEENLADVLNNVDCIAGIILKEAEEKAMQAFIKNEVEE